MGGNKNLSEVEKIYNKNCYLCEVEETTYCDACPAKEAILKAERETDN